MQTATIITLSVSILWIWFNWRIQMQLPPDPDEKLLVKLISVLMKRIHILTDFKPLNCEFCLTTWVGISLSIWYCDIFLLSLPIIYKLIKRL